MVEVLDNTYKSVGAKIRARRKQIEMTQAELAARAGVSLRALQQTERGESNPRADTLIAIAGALGSDAADFMPQEREKPIFLSKTVMTDPTALDGAKFLFRLLSVSPERRAVVLGFLFDDHSFFPDEVATSLNAAFSQLHEAKG